MRDSHASCLEWSSPLSLPPSFSSSFILSPSSLPLSHACLMSRQFTTLCKLSHQINQYCLDPRGAEVAANVLVRPDMSDTLLVIHYVMAKWPKLPLSAKNGLFPPDWLLSRSSFQQAVLSLLHLADFTHIQDKNFTAFTDYHVGSPGDIDNETPRHSPGPSAGVESSAAHLLSSLNCPNLSPVPPVHQSTNSPLSLPLCISTSQGPPPTPACWLVIGWILQDLPLLQSLPGTTPNKWLQTLQLQRMPDW